MSHPKDPHDPNFNPQEDDSQTTAKQRADVISTVLLATGTILIGGGLFSAGPVAILAGGVLIGTGFIVKP